MQENKCWQRLEAVIRWANMSANFFAHHIGLSRGENLYQIKRGNNGISLNLAERIVTHFPSINRLWLLTGEGDMLNEESELGRKIPFYRVDVERSIRQREALQAECTLSLPVADRCDLAMLYMGTAMGSQLPTGTIVFLKQVDALRVVRTTAESGVVRLVAGDKKNFDELTISTEEIEQLYQVSAKLTIN